MSKMFCFELSITNNATGKELVTKRCALALNEENAKIMIKAKINDTPTVKHSAKGVTITFIRSMTEREYKKKSVKIIKTK